MTGVFDDIVWPATGDFVRVRGRHWLVESAEPRGDMRPGAPPPRAALACVDDDAQGEKLSVLWDAEIDAEILPPEDWSQIGAGGSNEAATFAAYLRTAKWSAATSADPTLFQSPFRAGIRVDPYQLEPLRKALLLPRVNLLIADDVGLGKTIEAGLIVRELLLRRRIDYLVVAAPPSMTIQWREELESKFGLTLKPVDRGQVAELRKIRGYVANPWTTDSRFVVSHKLLIDEAYMAGLRDALGVLRRKSLLIIDEAHHAAPSSSQKYAIDSQFTKAIRDLAPRFEHRLFLTATPHNGHENSFAALMEMLDPQRFTRGVPIADAEKELAGVMVRRLKEDLRKFGEPFPERDVSPIELSGLPADAPELVLAEQLAAYGELREKRISGLRSRPAAEARLVFVGLQTRLLSSIPAFARTLRRHRDALQRAIDGATVTAFKSDILTQGQGPDDADQGATPEDEALQALSQLEDEAFDSATIRGAFGGERGQLVAELSAVDVMLKLADANRYSPDARVDWLVDWIGANLRPSGRWNQRRLILFTEWEDTRRWVEAQLREAFGDHDHRRIGVLSGVTSAERREQLKRAFNADPEIEPLRILICTDAAREGINLQQRCDALIHIDLPWNPSRLEQRNGRIDRKLQPAKKVFCRYFFYTQRPEDRVLQALVRKTEVIRQQLGSAGKVLGDVIGERLAASGIARNLIADLAGEIRDTNDDLRLRIAQRDLDDSQTKRMARLARELDQLRAQKDRAQRLVGVPPDELKGVVEAAVTLARRRHDASATAAHLPEAETAEPLKVSVFTLSPDDPAFAGDGAWAEAFDALRTRPREVGEPVATWRANAPVRPISFEPPITLAEDRDETGVVQVHLEHRLVRRLLSRFQAIGFQHNLSRACVIETAGSLPRVVLMARLSLYGPGAARLHEQIVPVSAHWTEPAGRRGPLKPLGERGGETTMAELDAAFSHAISPRQAIVDRVLGNLMNDVEDLKDELMDRARALASEKAAELVKVGEREAAALKKLLQDQLKRIEDRLGATQLELGFDETELRQAADDRRHMDLKRLDLARQIDIAPADVAAAYAVKASRIEPIGVVYLWPRGG
jgi:superfamily II DNA or RNA helicase